MRLHSIPLQCNIQETHVSKWTVVGRSACLELAVNSPLPAGWFLLRGVLRRADMTSSARLMLVVKDLEGQTTLSPIPVSRKGTVFELLHLPKGGAGFILELTNADGFEIQDISLSPVGRVERTVRMYRRVLPAFFKLSRARRQKIRLRFYTPFVDLRKAYRIVSQLRDYSPELSYERWLQEHGSNDENDRRLIKRNIKSWKGQPSFKIFILVKDDNLDSLKRSLESLQGQLYRNFSVTLLFPPRASVNIELLKIPSWVAIYKSTSMRDLVAFSNARTHEYKRSDWVIIIHDGVVLSEHALYWFGSEALHNKKAAFIYSDHDILSADGRRSEPVFKPDWSLELLRSTNYINCAAAVRADVLKQLGGLSLLDIHGRDNHALYLHISEQVDGEDILHIPAVLWHLPDVVPLKTTQDTLRKANPVRKHLRRLGIAATVERTSFGHHRVCYQLPEDPPMVSIIVPTRDALEHLRACIESVLNKSSYRNFELLVIDNQSSHPKTLAYLEELSCHPQVRVLRYNKPFNYSGINNFAVRHAKGKALCLLNNDTEVISADWMEEMLSHLLQPGVGVVGAKLYYGDGRVQHAGDTVGPGGCAHHLHAMIERDDPGYCKRAIVTQDLSAVTAACLMTWRSLYRQLDGLDRKNLPIAFNDVDYCLKVREKGQRVVWTPYAELYHHESISRGKEYCSEKDGQMKREIAYMRRRWKHVMSHDPFYNPNLSYDRPDFSLSDSPLVNKPWRC